VGWRDRDYARFTDDERRILYGTDRPSRRGGSDYTVPGQGRLFGSRGRPLSGIFAAVIVSLLVALGLGQLPRSHPLIPQLHLGFPSLSNPAKPTALVLPSRLPVGSYLSLHGRLGSDETGTVTVEGAYGRGPWQVLATGRRTKAHTRHASR
jgi:hypothetical protein